MKFLVVALIIFLGGTYFYLKTPDQSHLTTNGRVDVVSQAPLMQSKKQSLPDVQVELKETPIFVAKQGTHQAPGFEWFTSRWSDGIEGILSTIEQDDELKLSQEAFHLKAQDILSGFDGFFKKYEVRNGIYRGAFKTPANKLHAFQMKLKAPKTLRYPFRVVSVQWKDHWGAQGDTSPLIKVEHEWIPKAQIDPSYTLKFPSKAFGPYALSDCVDVTLFFDSVTYRRDRVLSSFTGPFYCRNRSAVYEIIGFGFLEFVHENGLTDEESPDEEQG